MINENVQRQKTWPHRCIEKHSTNTSNDRLLKFLQAPPEIQIEIDRILEGRHPVQQPEHPTGPLLLGMSAAAKFIGVSRATLWRICRTGRLQKVEILPGSFRIRRADLEAFAAGRKVGV